MMPPSSIDVPGALTFVVLVASGINVVRRPAPGWLQAKLRADAAVQEVALLKQFVAWKDEVLSAINGKYVSTTLIGEIKTAWAMKWRRSRPAWTELSAGARSGPRTASR